MTGLKRAAPKLTCLALILFFNWMAFDGFFSIRLQDGRLFGSLIDVLNRGAPGAGCAGRLGGKACGEATTHPTRRRRLNSSESQLAERSHHGSELKPLSKPLPHNRSIACHDRPGV